MRFLAILLLLSVLIHPSFVLAQDIIENPEKPLSEKAGRVLQLEEELRITDEGGGFFFKSPWAAKVDGESFVYVREKDKLYKFDKDGKFLKNILRSGEGPGEVLELASFEFNGDEIILFCSMRNKIIRIDKDGNLIQDLKLGEKRFSRLLSYREKKYFVIDFEWKSLERTTGIKEVNHTLYIADEEGKFSSTPYSFPTLQAMRVRTIGGRGSSAFSPITRIQTARAYPKYLYIAHTQDYLIKLLDLDTSQVYRTFKREYTKVKHESQELSEYLMTEYQNDIQNLLIYKDRLWVLTSTFKEGKGILVDVFNQEGVYLDNFYLPLFKIKRENLATWPMAVDGDALFVLEINEDETLAIVKYKILE
jgi:hypothetical protein